MANVNFKQYYLDVEGILRYYFLYVPSGVKDGEAVPLMILLHGAGGNPRTVRNLTGMNELAEKEGFIIAYPQGTGPRDRDLTWNADQCCGFAYENHIDDVGFIRELITEVSSQWDIDTQRVYAAGVSNGGMMTHRLACELPGQIAAAAVVAASLPKKSPGPLEPVSMIMFHGTADEYVPYQGGKSIKSVLQEPAFHTSVQETLWFWVKHNGCDPRPQVEEDGVVRKETYTGGIHQTEVILYTISGGGHTWPGAAIGRSNPQDPMQQIAATPLAWQFFQRHPRPG